MVGGEQCQRSSSETHPLQLEIGIIINVIEMHERKHTGIGRSALQVSKYVSTLELLA